MGEDRLIQITSLLNKLKDKIKCPICFEVIQDVRELPCGHKFCVDCLFEYKSFQKNVTCPLCKSVISRRTPIYKDEYSNRLGKFVHKIFEYITDHSNTKEQSILQEDIKSNEFIEIGIRKSKNKVKTKLKNKIVLDSSTSVPVKENPDTHKSVKVTYNSFLLNKYGTKQTYARKNKTKKSELEYKLHNFENSESKAFVVQWLNDTRNKFDRLTQTQQLKHTHTHVGHEGDKNSLNLPSISQIKESRNSNIYPLNHRGRAKSEEIEINKPDIPRRKTYSDFSTVSDNYQIEEVYTEEEKIVEKAEQNILLDIIETEYLNKLEENIESTQKCKEHKNKSVSKSDKNDTRNSNIVATPISVTGWNRMTDIKKSIKASSKVPKMLKVVLNTSQCSLKSKRRKDQKENVSLTANTNIPEDQKQSPKNLETKLNKPSEILQKEESTIQIPKKTYDLDTLESYIAQNILIENSKEDSHSKGNKDQENLYNKPSIDLEKECDVYLVPTQKLNFIENQEELIQQKEDIIPTQKLDKEDIRKNNDLFKLVEPMNEEICLNSNDISVENQIMHIDSTVHLLNVLEEYIERCKKTTKDYSLLEKNLLSMNLIINKIKFVGENIRLESEFTNNISTQTEINIVNQSVQTDWTNTNKETQTCKNKNVNASTQMNISEHVNKAVQVNLSHLSNSCTASNMINNDFNNGSTKILTPNMKAALESFANEPDMFAMKQSNTPTSAIKNVQPIQPQNDIFTCTFDNLNIDTQEIIKNKIQNPSQISKNPDTKNQEENTSEYSNKRLEKCSNSQLICTIQSTTVGKLKRDRSIERNNSIESDEEIKPRKKKNRFLNDDLTIEFTNTIKPYENELASPDSNSINYDECLDQILRNHDNKLSKKVENETNSENILKQCDDILQKVTRNQNTQSNIKQNSEFTDVISESESLEPIPKKPKLSSVVDQAVTNNNLPLVEVSNDKIQNNVCEELNDSLEDIDFENIEFLQEQKSMKSCINILDDVRIRNSFQEKKFNNNEDDMFSDDDIVESTPQKNPVDKQVQQGSQKNRIELIFSEANDANNIKNNCDLDIVVLPPPPGFQDFEKEEDSELNSTENITIINPSQKKNDIEINNLSSLSLSIKQQTKDEMICNKSYIEDEMLSASLHKPSLVNTSKIEHSTPLNQVDMRYQSEPCISPIPKEKENTLINAVQSSITSLITTPKRHTPKHNILSSTPKQKSIWNYVRPSQEIGNELVVKTKPCISCSRLSHSQIMLISQLTNKKLATYSSTFHKDVTHMIVTVDDDNCLKDYTAKFISAVAAGIWVLRFDWIQDSLNKNTILPEEPYEIYDDVHGTGPKMARLTKKKNPLFKGFKFHCTDDFHSTPKKTIENIIEMLEGQLVAKPEDLVRKDGKIGMIITEGRSTQDFEIYEHWLKLYKVATVDLEWLSRSIGRYKLLNIRPYIWCSDKYIGDLDYPEYLIEQVAFSTE